MLGVDLSFYLPSSNTDKYTLRVYVISRDAFYSKKLLLYFVKFDT